MNATSLGEDGPIRTPTRTPLLWEPDLGLAQGFRASFHRAEIRLNQDGSPVSPRGLPGEVWQMYPPEGRSSAGEPALPAIPSDRGAIRRDSFAWMKAGGRSPDEGLLVKILAERIRLELWKAMNTRSRSAIAAAVVNGGKVTVRVTPLDGTLQNYRLDLRKHGAPQTDVHQVQWALNLQDGSIEPMEYGGHHPWEEVARERGVPLRGFIPIYRNIRFATAGLRGDPLLIELSPDLIEFHCRKTVLVRHFSKISERVRQAVERHCVSNRLSRGAGERLQVLMKRICEALRDKEIEDPSLVCEPMLQIWIRKPDETLDRAVIEILTRAEGFQKPHQKHDILLTLLRNPKVLNEKLPFLQHEYIHLDPKGRPVDDDLEFEDTIGRTGLPLRLYLDALHVRPPELDDWDREAAGQEG
ncbi:MAG TPA: hypothetical protein VLJ37_09885 [bacterium]|nr:hypothetical protein [bacterium]